MIKNIKNFKFTIIIFCIVCQVYPGYSAAKNMSVLEKSYLSQPTGQYGVAFQDFHWIDNNNCPDPNFDGKNKNSFSQKNINYCHEIVARIYYPTYTHNQKSVPYYPAFIKSEQEMLRKIPDILQLDIDQLNQVKSCAMEKAPILKGRHFPVILFSPGFGYPAQLYENIIGELASQGYIVIGINTAFINLVELPNGAVVNAGAPKSMDDNAVDKFLALQRQDLFFIYNQIHIKHRINSIFSAMDLKHIGAFGHSIGGKSVADFAHQYSGKLQAAASLDTAIDPTGRSLKKFAIPFMHEISANRISASPFPVAFELGKNSYLIGIAPDEQNHDYSYHMNFTDLSTLQYHPAIKAYVTYLKHKSGEPFDLNLLSHDPTEQECESYKPTTYVLIKKANKWDFVTFKEKKKVSEFGTDRVQGLDAVLYSLPDKKPELLTDFEIEPIRKVILNFQHERGQSFGAGDGWELTHSINIYLVKFFDTFLKNDMNLELKNCSILSRNTYIKCGSDQLG